MRTYVIRPLKCPPLSTTVHRVHSVHLSTGWTHIPERAKCRKESAAGGVRRPISSGAAGKRTFLCADVDDSGRWYPVPAAVPMSGPIRKAVLARLSVCVSAALRHKQPDQQPPLPPFAARLYPDKPGTDLRTPSAPLAYAAGSRTLKEKRSRDCDRTSRPQTLAGQSPLAPQGENNRPGGVVPARPSVP